MLEIDRLKAALEGKLGGKPAVSVGDFTNWGGLQTIHNLLVVAPSDLTEIQNVVCAARDLQVCCGICSARFQPFFSCSWSQYQEFY